jgi:hypothetical protein
MTKKPETQPQAETPDDDLVDAVEREPRVAYVVKDGKLVEVPVPEPGKPER